MKTIVTKIFHFCYGHCLPEHPGKCKQIHGHNAILEVSVLGKVKEKTGMVIDFGDISIFMKSLIKSFDHNYLNSIFPANYLPPTAENICEYIWDSIEDKINNKNICLYKIKFYETPNSFVERLRHAKNK